jgi:hypothetical protein
MLRRLTSINLVNGLQTNGMVRPQTPPTTTFNALFLPFNHSLHTKLSLSHYHPLM